MDTKEIKLKFPIFKNKVNFIKIIGIFLELIFVYIFGQISESTKTATFGFHLLKKLLQTKPTSKG